MAKEKQTLTEVRVLKYIHTLDAQPNSVIELTAEQLVELADYVDSNETAVAYAKSIVVDKPVVSEEKVFE